MTYQPHNDPSHPGATFRLLVKWWVQSKDTARTELAREFEVGQSTVDRWWIGSATPHPLLQARVVEWIRAHKDD